MFWEVEIPHGELEGVDDQQVEEGDDDHPAEDEEQDAGEEAEHLEVDVKLAIVLQCVFSI